MHIYLIEMVLGIVILGIILGVLVSIAYKIFKWLTKKR